MKNLFTFKKIALGLASLAAVFTFATATVAADACDGTDKDKKPVLTEKK